MTANQEKRDQQQTSNGFLLGAIIGGVVGAATALFLAPKPGKELRNDLTEQAKYVKERSDMWKDQAVTKSTELAENAKRTSISLAEKVQQESKDVVEKVKEYTNMSQNGSGINESEPVTTIPLPTEATAAVTETEKEDSTEMEYSK